MEGDTAVLRDQENNFRMKMFHDSEYINNTAQQLKTEYTMNKKQLKHAMRQRTHRMKKCHIVPKKTAQSGREERQWI